VARSTIKMAQDEDAVLKALYVDRNIPTDQYPQRPKDLESLVSSWNAICGRGESEPDILHYMITKRKSKLWPRLGRDEAEKLRTIAMSLTEEELEQLDAIHEELQIASDSYAVNKEYADKLKNEFAKRTGRVFPPMLLAAAMINRRKAGRLATLKPEAAPAELKFADIDKVVG
jgi:hypothetical protein